MAPERISLAAMIALLLFLLGCSQQVQEQVSDSGEPVAGDTIIQGSIGEPNTLLPVLASDNASSQINSLVYSGLVRYDKNFVPKVNSPSRGKFLRII